jgi:hypothetical protein
MKLDPGMHIGMHLVFFGKSGVTLQQIRRSVGLRFSPEFPNMASSYQSSGSTWRGQDAGWRWRPWVLDLQRRRWEWFITPSTTAAAALGLGPAPWFCLAVLTDSPSIAMDGWGGSQAPTTLWAEFGPGGRWPPVELVAQPLVVGPKAQVHVWLWAVGQFLPWAKRIDMVINLLSLIKSWCWYVITLVYFILKFCL